MKILAIGDLHGKIPSIPKDIDLILLTGDLGKSDIWRNFSLKNLDRKRKGFPEIENPRIIERGFWEWYNSSKNVLKKLSKIAPVYFVSGNIEKDNKRTKKLSEEVGRELPFLFDFIKKLNVRFINSKVVNFKGIKIGGMGYFSDVSWIRRFEPEDEEWIKKARQKSIEVKNALKKFKGIDILLSHIPPYGILDKVTSRFAPKNWKGKHAGSEIILNYIKKNHPRYVICGHIHEGTGEKQIGKTKVINLGKGNYGTLEIE